jgi:hypothetical protein
VNLKSIVEVLQIVAKYSKDDKDYCCAEHDILFLPLQNDAPISPEDEARLLELRAHRSSEGECWAVFT